MVRPGATRVEALAEARAVLRDGAFRQAGFRAEILERFGGRLRAPILFQEGEAHRRQRAAIARFFAPRTVQTAYRTLMEGESETILAAFVARGHGRLDEMSLALSVAVASTIIGLTASDRAGMARRLDAFFSGALTQRTDPVSATLGFLFGQWRLLRFYWADVRPAIRARRRAPAADVISHLLAEGYRPREIMTECLTYAAAGMATTREFITLAGWHLLTDDDLRAAFCAGDDVARGKMLAELLRLEPVVGTLYRRGGPADALLALNVRAINADAAGSCPHAFEAGRAAGAALSFGDGPHRCPGAEVALQESAIFLARLLAVPGLRLVSPPRMRWNAVTTGYELRDMRLACTADR